MQPTLQPSLQSRITSNAPTIQLKVNPSTPINLIYNPSNQLSSQPSFQSPVNNSSSQYVPWSFCQPTIQPMNQPSIQTSRNPLFPASLAPSSYSILCPTINPSFQPTSEISLLIITPEIVKIKFHVKKSSVIIEVTLSVPGLIYCGISNDLNMTVQSIILQNNFAVVVGNGKNLTIGGLEPSTSYNIFCLSESSDGFTYDPNKIVKAFNTITTSCCKQLSVSLASTIMRENQITYKFLTISVSQSLTNNLIIKTSCLDYKNNTKAIDCFYPSVFTFDALQYSSGSISVSSTILPLQIGTYKMVLFINGTSEYDVIYSNGYNITVLSLTQEPPLPYLKQAIFSSDGSYLIILFDSPTNKGGIAGKFTCAILFNFDCASSSTCLWIDDSTVNVYFPALSGNCSVPNDRLSLSVQSRIQAKCHLTIQQCNSAHRKYINNTAVITIEQPLLPIFPAIIALSPSVIGICDDILIDVSTSTGNAGRDWKSVTMYVKSNSKDRNTDININKLMISSNFTIFPPCAIPSYYLAKGVSFSFNINLCNFLGICSDGRVTVLVKNEIVPYVSILGNPYRSIYVNNPLILYSESYIESKCTNIPSLSMTLQYDWSYAIGGNNFMKLTSYANPTILPISPYFFNVSQTYLIILNVSIYELGVSSTSSVQITVQSGKIVPVIQGSLNRNVRVGEQLLIDASNSYDENILNRKGKFAGLVYQWTCIQIDPIFASDCSNILSNRSISDTGSYMAYYKNEAIVKIQLTILDVSRVRSAVSDVAVNIISKTSPLVTNLVSKTNSFNVNSNSELQLIGSINTPIGMFGNATWSIGEDNYFDLELAALSPVNTYFNRASPYFAPIVTMTIGANTLPTGSLLTFILTSSVHYQGKLVVSSAYLTVSINSPPRSGKFIVKPSYGSELIDPFNFIAQNWLGDNLPLTYQFVYQSAANNSITVLSRSEKTYGVSSLPAGLSSDNYMLTCRLVVYDFLDSSGRSEYLVHVTKVKPMNATQTFDYVNTKLQTGLAMKFDRNALKQSITLTAYLVNSVNCSMAIECSAINRKPCSSTPHTCGACLSDQFIGQEGDSNSPCEKYINAKELNVGKHCPSNCSGHGVCNFINVDSGSIVDTCLSTATTCKAVCACDVGYSLSSTCSASDSDMERRQVLREKVIDSIVQLDAVQTTDSQSVTDLIGYLSEATQNSEELNTNSSQKLINLVQSIAIAMSQVTVTTSTVFAAMNIIDSVLSSNINDYSNNDVGSNILDSLSLSIKSYGTLLTSNMLPGQDSNDGIYDKFRITNNVLSSSISSSSSKNLQSSSSAVVYLPLSRQEQFNNLTSSEILLPLNSLNGSSSDNQYVQFTAYSIYSTLYNNSKLTSNPLTLHFSQSPCNSKHCPVVLVLPLTKQINLLSNNSKEIFKLNCQKGIHNSTSIRCSNGQYLTLTCNGTVSGIISQQCPVRNEYHECRILQNSLLSAKTTCTVESVDDASITCRCLLSDQSFSRRLDSNSTSSSEYTISYASIISSSVDEFTSTITDYSILETITTAKGLKVLLTIVVIILIAGISFIFAKRSDDLENENLYRINTEHNVGLMTLAAGTSRRTNGISKRDKFSNKLTPKVKEDSINKLLNDSLPVIFDSSNKLSHKVVYELKRHHKWFAIIYFHSDKFPRSLRLLSMISNIVIMLFIQSLTYNITSPDDHSCDAYTTRSACITPRSDFATGASKCSWSYDSSSQTTGTCTFNQPNGDITVILFVALFSAVISTPFAVVVDWIIINVLAAESKPSEAIQVTNAPHRVDQLYVNDNEMIVKQSEIDFTNLAQNINRFRETLQESERITFDGNIIIIFIYLIVYSTRNMGY